MSRYWDVDEIEDRIENAKIIYSHGPTEKDVLEIMRELKEQQ